MTKIVDSSKLTARRMQGIIETIRVYWNLFIPAFPDGRTPAEAAGVKPRSWMQPLLTTCERLDKLAVGIHPVDRYSEIVGQILSKFKRGLSTSRTEAITKIMEGLEYGPVEQPPWDIPRRPRISPKHRSSLGEPLEPPNDHNSIRLALRRQECEEGPKKNYESTHENPMPKREATI